MAMAQAACLAAARLRCAQTPHIDIRPPYSPPPRIILLLGRILCARPVLGETRLRPAATAGDLVPAVLCYAMAAASSASCPCCGSVVAIEQMNVHLDGCLIIDTEPPPSSSVAADGSGVWRRRSARRAAQQQQHAVGSPGRLAGPEQERPGRAARVQFKLLGQPTQVAGGAATATRQRRQQQQHNRMYRGGVSCTSIYRGVSWNKQRRKWAAYIRRAGKRQTLGYFAEEVAAARAYDIRARQILQGSAQPNFPRAGERQSAAQKREASAASMVVVAARRQQRQSTSKFRGVAWAQNKRTSKAGGWVARISHHGRSERVGYYDDETEAARAYDTRAREVFGAAVRTNFPRAGERPAEAPPRMDPQTQAACETLVAARRRQHQATSSYRGVSWSKRRRGWRAEIKHGGKPTTVGIFADEREAARAYDTRARELRGAAARLNFPRRGELGHAESSSFRGVVWCKKWKKWCARIQCSGRQRQLGGFDTEEEAARAW
jgi:hypothetical protein